MLVGYLFTVLNYICYCSSRFQKDKKNILLFDIVAKVFMFVGLWCMGSATGSYNIVLSLVLLFISYTKEVQRDIKNKRLDFIIYALFILSYICVLVLTYRGISSILTTCTSLVTLTSIWWLSPQGMRKAGIVASILYLFYQLSIKNWFGLLELFVLVSNVMSWFKYKDRGSHE